VAADTNAAVVPWTVVDGSPENGLLPVFYATFPRGDGTGCKCAAASPRGPSKKALTDGEWACWLPASASPTCASGSIPAKTISRHPCSGFIAMAQWSTAGDAGNGALALGNRLAATLKIPIGLLDYSVNGTGLTAKAEWGKGFWLDTGPTASIGDSSTGSTPPADRWRPCCGCRGKPMRRGGPCPARSTGPPWNASSTIRFGPTLKTDHPVPSFPSWSFRWSNDPVAGIPPASGYAAPRWMRLKPSTSATWQP
jgi:hypothetical protein